MAVTKFEKPMGTEVQSLSEQIGKLSNFNTSGFTDVKTFSGASSYSTDSFTLSKPSIVNCTVYLGKIFVECGQIKLSAYADITQNSGGFMNIIPAGTYLIAYVGNGSNSSAHVLVQEL